MTLRLLLPCLVILLTLLLGTLADPGSLGVLGHLECTAGDIAVNGAGKILNEPCGCLPGQFFNAQVRFEIESRAQNRFCFSMYLCDAFNTSLVLNETLQRGTFNYTFVFPHYPCATGLRCFGFLPDGLAQGSAFPKGVRCPDGKCCDTIAYAPNEGSECPLENGHVVPSKCRHNQVCILGKAIDLKCVTGCSGRCGPYDATLQLCDGGFLKPATFNLSANGDVISSHPGINGNCSNFTVRITEDNTSFLGTIIGADDCSGLATLNPPLRFNDPSANLTCSNNCNLQCGNYTATLRVCGTSFTGPFNFSLFDELGQFIAFKTSTSPCVTFDALISSNNTLFSATVKGSDNCIRTALIDSPLLFADPSATLTCVNKCTFSCGQYTATLELCGVGVVGSEFSFDLLSSQGVTQHSTGSGPCANFSVVVNASGITYQGNVTGSSNCVRKATASALGFTPSHTVALSFLQDGCAATGVFTATTTGAVAPIYYTFSVNGFNETAQLSNTFTYPGHTDGTCYTVDVATVDANSCTGDASPIRLSQCVTLNQDCLA